MHSSQTRVKLRRSSNGMLLMPEEFDAVTDYDERYRYELIHGVVVVNPIPGAGQGDPNEELGRFLRNYQDCHPKGKSLDKTLAEQYVYLAHSRRLADRVIWAGLGWRPNLATDVPTIVAEFVSKRKRDRRRDYEEKRDEYLAIGVKEYWIIDRFLRTMTVLRLQDVEVKETVVGESETYQTGLLPGFELPLASLLTIADEWDE